MRWVYVLFVCALLGFIVGWDFGVAWGVGVGVGGFIAAVLIWNVVGVWASTSGRRLAEAMEADEAALTRLIEAMTPERRRERASELIREMDPWPAEGDPPAALARAPGAVREALTRWSHIPVDRMGGAISWEAVAAPDTDDHGGRLVIGRLHDGEPVLADPETGAVGILWEDDPWDARADLWTFLLYELEEPPADEPVL